MDSFYRLLFYLGFKEIAVSKKESDLTINHLRSFSFSKAESLSTERIHRIDELRNVIISVFDEDGLKEFKDFKKNIAENHLIEDNSKEARELMRELRIQHNSSQAMKLRSKIKG